MHKFMFGSTTENAKGQHAVLRRMRRDSNGDCIPCVCVDSKTGEPDIDTVCPYCWGEGFYWSEEWITIYKRELSRQEGKPKKDQPYKAGILVTPLFFIYTEYHVEPRKEDKIVEMRLDAEGDVSTPYEREAIYTIATPEAFRSDSGRVEYWRLACIKDTVRSNWQG
jgi:hypothetical protein